MGCVGLLDAGLLFLAELSHCEVWGKMLACLFGRLV